MTLNFLQSLLLVIIESKSTAIKCPFQTIICIILVCIRVKVINSSVVVKMSYLQTAVVLMCLFFVKAQWSVNNKKCVKKYYKSTSVVCVCNSTYCDELYVPDELPKGKYLHYSTTRSGLRFEVHNGKFREQWTNNTKGI